MKVTQIRIIDFHQFKDLTIDLTYPNGHEKEGQPLDKVCFIGQSGTGKTSILELIPKFLFNYETNFTKNITEMAILDKMAISVTLGEDNRIGGTLRFSTYWGDAVSASYSVINWRCGDFFDLEKQSMPSQDGVYFLRGWHDIMSQAIYIPATLNFNIDIGREDQFIFRPIIDFSTENVAAVWHLILDKVQKYQEQELQIRQDISKTVEQASNNIDVIQSALKKLVDWKETEFNPLKDIADNCLNRLLAPFKLRVKTELDFKSKDDIGFIKIEDFEGNEIPNGLWSTGTKQVVLAAMPLYLLKPKNTVILFDEPERSLYPDMQRMIVDYYTSLTDNCQFFYATHSPIVASSFEPWEIVELKFNKEGKIYRELYYEGENHVDNYKWNPKHMRWDDILQRIFDMETDGSADRKSLLDDLASKNVKYKKLDKQGLSGSEEARGLLERIAYLRKELSHWD